MRRGLCVGRGGGFTKARLGVGVGLVAQVCTCLLLGVARAAGAACGQKAWRRRTFRISSVLDVQCLYGFVGGTE